ncbi:hypothetical protein NGG04_08715 [Mammaliicoccus sciuri]|uniref:McrB family protein n=1 Tax=Staphylococcaceae TaxID=90964 RepID=UPI001E43D98E|nr:MULTISPECIES: hypothetical protein [Staphylococcaceae]MCD8847358.1 hypothetical protein [Mammaliicoccus sciuri]MCD8909527.1 hypothetical protein [Staphylococcus gallinarum]MEB6118575.1 hypothetical protein [Mammaliicoccus sciuri]MEB6253453.1 hypothetical protein [Mammaliicoccus sciuri]MEB7403952.1 hypothetical protein [Mammaliicoccus sciuri]
MKKDGYQKYLIIGEVTDLEKIKTGNNGYVYFWMSPLNDFPNSVIDDVPGIQIYANELRSYGFHENNSLSEAEQAEALFDFVKDYLIVCNPVFSRTTDGVYCKGKNIHLIKKNQYFNNEDKLVAIPVFSEKTEIKEKDKFLNNLKNERIIGKIENYSSSKEDHPDFFLWKENENNYLLFGKIISHESSSYGIKFKLEDNKILCAEINEQDDWNTKGYLDRNFIFISYDILLEKINELEEEKERESLKNENETENTEKISLVTNDKENEIVITKEEEFMRRFIRAAQLSGLFYEKKDLYNFHASMKTGGLVVLAGLSGTGKSKLISTYIRALQLTESQVKFIPVRPFWDDDSDLLGYADTINSLYRPGDSGLVDLLKEAEKNPENLYLICFDEMNLAKVEHYFSQFLSVLEMEEGSREILLYNSELENRLYNGSYYGSTIKIGSNIMFVGTINMDESTHQFSDKVLDRSNIISLNMVPFNQQIETNETEDNKQIVTHKIKTEDYKAFKHSSMDNKLTGSEKDMLWRLHLAINNADRNVGIGRRIVNQLEEYLINIPKNDYLKREEAIDLQLVQRVVTKIRGSEEQLGELLGYWKDGEFQLGEIEIILNEYNDSSEFVITRKAILDKAKELKLHGFTI